MQFEAVVTWAASKGIELAGTKAGNLVRQFLELKTLEELIHLELSHISGQLSAIIKAPYKRAILHLREGEITECKNRLIEAISLNEIDLPAKLLYIDILRFQKKYDIALEQYWDLLDTFGFHENLVPPLVFEEYVKQYFKDVSINGVTEAEIDPSCDSSPKDLWCSPRGIAIRWEERWSAFFPFFPKSVVSAHAWRKDPRSYEGVQLDNLFWEEKNNPHIALVTGKCVILQYGNEYCSVRSLKDGSLFPERLSMRQMQTLFASENRLVSGCCTTDQALNSYAFGGVSFIEIYRETGSSPGFAGSAGCSRDGIHMEFAAKS